MHITHRARRRLPGLLLAFGFLLPLAAPASDSTPDTLDLDRRLKVVERTLEIQREDDAAKARSASQVSASEKGLSIKAANGAYALDIGALAQIDARFYIDQAGVSDAFLLRRLRPVILKGSFGDWVAFNFSPEFATGSGVSGDGSTASIADAYLDLKFSPAATLRAGRQKTPVGLEQLQSDALIGFTERGYTSELVPNRDLGAVLQGVVLKQTLSYALGLFGGAPDGRDLNRINADNRFEIAARLFAEPFKNDYGLWRGLGYGLGGSYENALTASPSNVNDALPRYRSPGQQIFFQYVNGGAPNNTVLADGRHWRLAPQLYYYNGPFGLLGEYAVSRQKVVLNGTHAEFGHQAWLVRASYVLTGEDVSYAAPIKPRRPFSLGGEGWGAFSVDARLEAFAADPKAFDLNFADLGKSAKNARSAGVALNWYLTSNLKLAADYELTRFDGGAAAGKDRPNEQAVFSRLQLAF
ncbi:MAG: porin [Nevskia sp.]|nr:porin [Nevskia sp.]